MPAKMLVEVFPPCKRDAHLDCSGALFANERQVAKCVCTCHDQLTPDEKLALAQAINKVRVSSETSPELAATLKSAYTKIKNAFGI